MKTFYTFLFSYVKSCKQLKTTILPSAISTAFTKTGKNIFILLVALATINTAKAQTCPSGNTVYVDSGNTSGIHDGATWGTAFSTLQDALYITSTCTGSKQIWVAKGTYYPDEGGGQQDNNQNATFQLKNNLAVYGGFAGNENSLASRNWKTNVTILNGDIDKNNLTDTANSYHVVTGSGTNTTALLDGFTITGGNLIAREGSATTLHGAGMLNIAGSPAINNCIFSGNLTDASATGGGMYNGNNANPKISNCTFSDNYGNIGGGMANENSSPVIINCIFSANAGGLGGGMYNGGSNPVIVNCSFLGNSAGQGGGIYNFGELVITNCTFSGNVSNNGGGMYVLSGKPVLTNCTFSGNLANSYGGGIYSYGSNPIITNCIAWNNKDVSGTGMATASIYNDLGTPAIRYSLVQNITTADGNGNLDGITDSANINHPLFVTPLNPATAPSTGGNFHLQCFFSPAIDKGSNSADTESTDLDGNFRIINGTIDLGAYENQGNCCPADNIVHVDSGNVSGTHDGTTWATAFSTLQDALALAGNCSNVQQIWVAKGTYYPDEGGGKTINDVNAKFQLKNNLAVYGGFAGTETSLSQRNYATNTTILSGDIDKNNMADAGNTIIIVTASNVDTSAKLDGFIITGGFTDAFDAGAGMYNESASPTVTNCTFSGNTSAGYAGAMFNDVSSPVITNCVFSGNKAAYNGGAMWNSSGSNPVITNCTFTGNSADEAGAMLNEENSNPVITNCIIWNNKDNFGAPSIFNSSNSAPVITYSLIQGDTPSGTGNLDGITNAGNPNYPLFKTMLDPAVAPSANGDFHLQCGSPVIDKGSNSADTLLTDLSNNSRTVNNTIDFGAYENQGGCAQLTTTTIAGSGSPSCQGSTVKFTATVLVNGNAGTAATTGGVTFTQGNIILADSIAVDVNGQASFSTDTLGAGAHTIIATYKPAPGFSSSNNYIIQTINASPGGTISGNATYCSGNYTTTSLKLSVTGSGTISGTLSDNTLFSGTAPTINVPVAPTQTTTYTIATLNDAYCTARSTGLTGSATITINPKPVVSPVSYAGSTSVCSGSAASLTDATAGGVWSTSNAAATVTTSGKVTFAAVSASTAVTIYYTVNSNGCSSQATIVFTVNPPITVKSITGNTTICGVNSTTQLSDATSGGTWSSSNISVATVSNTGLVTGKVVGSAIIYYTVSSGGCTASAQTGVSVNKPPAIASIQGYNAVTKGFSTQLSDATKGGVWSSSNTAIASVSTTGLVKGIAVGSCTIRYTVTSSPCSAVASQAMNVYNPITATVTQGKIRCNGGTTTLTINASGGSGKYRYSLNNSNYQTSNIFTVRAGDYTVYVADQATYNTKPYATSVRVVQPTPLGLYLQTVTNASSKTAADGSFTVFSKGGTPSYQYSKNGGVSYQSSGTFPRLTAGTYKVSVKDANGCVALNILTVNVGVGGKSASAIAEKLPEGDAKITTSVYPNPSVNSFNLQLKSSLDETVEIKVTDMLGHTVYHTTGSATGSYKFGEHFTGGLYIVEVVCKTGVKTLKIVKQ